MKARTKGSAASGPRRSSASPTASSTTGRAPISARAGRCRAADTTPVLVPRSARVRSSRTSSCRHSPQSVRLAFTECASTSGSSSHHASRDQRKHRRAVRRRRCRSGLRAGQNILPLSGVKERSTRPSSTSPLHTATVRSRSARAADGSGTLGRTRFAHHPERRFAELLDFYGIEGNEPRTFVLSADSRVGRSKRSRLTSTFRCSACTSKPRRVAAARHPPEPQVRLPGPLPDAGEDPVPGDYAALVERFGMEDTPRVRVVTVRHLDAELRARRQAVDFGGWEMPSRTRPAM